MFSLASPSLLLGALLFSNSIVVPVIAFAPGGVRTTPLAQNTAATKPQTRTGARIRDISILFESNNDHEPTRRRKNNNNDDNSIFQRFLDPVIDDPGLPYTDILLAQIVAPTFQILWLVLNHAPNPSWLQPIGSYFGDAPELAPRGSVLAPTLIHGAGLAVCWLSGALAAKSFEAAAFTVKDNNEIKEDDDDNGRRGRRRQSSATGILDVIARYDTILLRLFQAGAFASGLLIISTQADLLLEFKGHWVQFGESDETDFRIFLAAVEAKNDIFWEAFVISTWRIIHANFMSGPDNRLKRF